MRKPNDTFAPKRLVGMSLIELMIALGIAGVLLGLAAPNFSSFMKSNRLTGAANDLLRSLQTARNEAVKRQLAGPQSVVVCASADPTAATPACSFGRFSGWIVFADLNSSRQYDAGEPLIEQHATLDSSVTVQNDAGGVISYNVNGFSNPGGTQNIVLCDSRGVTPTSSGSTLSNARAVIVRATGRARATNLQADAVTAKAATGASCP